MGLKLFHQRVLALAALVYAITAWNSTGFPVADEHYQIIEFAQWKLGDRPADQLVWEFEAGIRSSLQPWIAVRVFRAVSVIGIQDPFVLAALLRLLTAAMALAALRAFLRATLGSVAPAAQKAYILLTYLLWFLPFLLVRFGSEGWSAIFLLGMLAAVLRRGWLWPLQAGLWAGIAILCRPPVGLLVLSAMAWMRWGRGDRWGYLIKSGAGVVIVLLIGLALDRSFYGSLVPSTWNYLHLGFTGDPARFDPFPWYYYPPWIFKYAIPPIGVAILLAVAFLSLKQPRHLAVWCTLPFLLVHTLVPHKELRFLFPLVGLTPWMLVSAWSQLPATWTGSGWWRALARPTVAVLALINLVALLAVLSSPADGGRKRLVDAVRQQAPEQAVTINYWMDTVPPWAIRVPPFYLPPGASEHMITDPCAPADQGTADVLFLVADRPLPDCPEQGEAPWELVRELDQPWEAMARRLHAWEDAKPGWTLYQRPIGPSTLAP